MKDFFEDLGKRLSETAEAVTAKAGDAIEIQKLKAQIRELARGNAEDLMELGQSMTDLRMEKNWMRLPRDCARQLQAARKAWKSMRIRLKGSKVRVSVHGVVRWLRKIWLSAHTADHL